MQGGEKARRRASRRCGALPAISALLMASIDGPTIQSGCNAASGLLGARLVGAACTAALQNQHAQAEARTPTGSACLAINRR